jgi:CubicO group peptidase (beta-lactamase class C family)
MNDSFSSRLDRVIDDTDLSGVVHIARAERILYARARGLADRVRGAPNTLDTQFAIASGTKGLTALAVMPLVAEGRLALDATVESVLEGVGDLVDLAVTVHHLLAHTSGMGGYLNERAMADIVAPHTVSCFLGNQ